MAQRASLRDQTSLAVEKRRSNRTVYILRSGSRAAWTVSPSCSRNLTEEVRWEPLSRGMEEFPRRGCAAAAPPGNQARFAPGKAGRAIASRCRQGGPVRSPSPPLLPPPVS